MHDLAELINSTYDSLTFTLLEIGALPISGENEPFYQLITMFPGSKMIGFEVDEALCNALNEKAEVGFEFHPVALSEYNAELPFYETVHAMCSSLYKPNNSLLEKYNKLDVAMLKKTASIKTKNLDSYMKKCNLNNIDFIKIDIQGAELDVFKGGIETLKHVTAIVSEVEFIPLYEKQPLFGDVCEFLSKNRFMFHHFLGISGRTLKPITLNNNPLFSSQQMWSDAFFIRDVFNIETISDEKLLKLAILSCLYDSVDVAYQCFWIYDVRNKTELCNKFMKLLH